MTNPLNRYTTEKGKYPSNVQVWHVAKDADDRFDPDLLDNVAFGTTPAPKGLYIVRSFNKNRQGFVGGISPENQDSPEPTMPTTNTFFAGRYWCAGLTTSKSSGKIFYSQILDKPEKAGKCYTENDPTAEQFNEPLDTDGGVIYIAEIGQIYKLAPVGTGVAVLASNGIWFIRGGDQKGFTPTAHSIIRASTDGCVSHQSVVSVNNQIFYWGDDGVYALNFSELDGLNSTDLSSQTIKSFYEAIPTTSKTTAQGFYNVSQQKIHWLYKSTESSDGSRSFDKDRVLTFDLRLQAFFTYSIKEANLTGLESPMLIAGFENIRSNQSTRVENLVVGVDPVVVGADQVTVNITYQLTAPNRIKGVAIVPNFDSSAYHFTFAEFNNDNFKDWESFDSVGADAYAYAIPAYEILGEPSREKRATYVTCHFQRTETGFDANLNALNPSGCYMQAQWDWADSDSGNLRGTQQQVYRFNRNYIPTGPSDDFDYGQYVITTRTKIRGSGHSLTLKFSSEEGKDFKLMGWTMNASVRV